MVDEKNDDVSFAASDGLKYTKLILGKSVRARHEKKVKSAKKTCLGFLILWGKRVNVVIRVAI